MSFKYSCEFTGNAMWDALLVAILRLDTSLIFGGSDLSGGNAYLYYTIKDADDMPIGSLGYCDDVNGGYIVVESCNEELINLARKVYTENLQSE